MAIFVTKGRLLQAVKRLQDSRVEPTVVDFLIIKRAMKLLGSDRVEVGTTNAPFVQAIKEFVLWEDTEGGESSWFNPFGTSRSTDLGYRTDRYPSNGTAVTVPHWTDLIEVTGKNKARIVKLRDGYQEELRDSFTMNAQSPLPQIEDAACWFYRSTDLLKRLGEAPAEPELAEAFVDDIGLSKAETAALFEGGPHAKPAP